MKLIVAGGRDFTDRIMVARYLEGLHRRHTLEIVTGMARGADLIAYEWALANNCACAPFPADWENITLPGAIVRYTRSGRPYDARAGHRRNQAMADYATHLLAFWDWESRGTADMIERMVGKPTHVVRY